MLALAGVFPLNNTDGYGHLAQGRNIAELGRVPNLDPFSFWKPTPQPWHNYEWGYDIVSYWIFEALGPNGLLFAKCVLLFVLGVVLVRTARLLAKGAALASPVAVTVLLLAVPASRFRLTERPHMVGILCAALLFAGLAKLARGPSEDGGAKRPWLLVAGLALMHVVWVNCHGSHLLGFLVTGLYGVVSWRDRKALTAIAVLAALEVVASGISPFGYKILIDAIEHVIRPEYRAVVTEWAPWSPTDPVGFPLLLGAYTLLLLLCIQPLARAGAAERAALIAAVVMSIMAVRSLRFIAEYTLLAAPAVAAGLVPRVERRGARLRAFLATAVLALAVFASTQLPPDVKWGVGESLYALPAASGDWLRARLPRPRILAPMPESWYLMWKVPEAKFLLDGRTPFYGTAHVVRVDSAMESGPGLRALVEEFDVDTFSIEFASPKLQVPLATLRGWADWRLALVEDQHALFVRADRFPADATPLVVLPPLYDPAPILDPRTSAAAVWADLRALGTHANGEGYRSFVKGLLDLRPLARAGSMAGLRAPANEGERARARQALTWLNRAHARVPRLQTVEVMRAMAALAVCDIETAKAALASAREDIQGVEPRDVFLTEKEIQLRTGDTAAVRAFLDEANAQPGVREDAALRVWLPALEADLSTGINCR